MSYTPDRLGHVNIFVRNAEQSQKWYEDVLGLHTYSLTPGRAAFMSANLDESHEIALVEGARMRLVPSRAGWGSTTWRGG